MIKWKLFELKYVQTFPEPHTAGAAAAAAGAVKLEEYVVVPNIYRRAQYYEAKVKGYFRTLIGTGICEIHSNTVHMYISKFVYSIYIFF